MSGAIQWMQFTNILSNGKIAMKFEGEDADDRLIGVGLLTEDDDVLLASRGGRAVRFMGSDIRAFQSRSSTGVRGMRLASGDEVISLSILRRSGASIEEREAYLKYAPWKPEKEGEPALSPERMAELADKEQFILTVCANGYGKRSSAYEYARKGRGGQGLININRADDYAVRNGPVVASFPARNGEQIMLVTDQAKLIRMEVSDMRPMGRSAAGVKLFNVAENEHIVSCALIEESDDEAELVGELEEGAAEAGTAMQSPPEASDSEGEPEAPSE